MYICIRFITLQESMRKYIGLVLAISAVCVSLNLFAKNDFEEPLLREAARDRFVSLLTLADMINDTVEAVR